MKTKCYFVVVLDTWEIRHVRYMARSGTKCLGVDFKYLMEIIDMLSDCANTFLVFTLF